MSDLQNNGVNYSPVPGNAPTTAQTAADGTPAQNTYNTASAYTPPTTAYTAQTQQPYAPPGYVQGTPVFTQYQPVQTPVQPRRLSAPVRVLLWICGIAAALTLLFGCAVVWVLGLRTLQNAVSSPSHSSSENSQNGNGGNGGEYGGFGFSDGDGGFGSGDLPDYGDFGSILPYFENDDGNSSSQSSNAGLGIKVTEIQLEFTVEDKYDSGLVIVEINDDSSFKDTDVRENDLIVAMDGTTTPDYDTLKGLLGKKQPGDTAEFTIARYEKGVASTYTVTVTLIALDND